MAVLVETLEQFQTRMKGEFPGTATLPRCLCGQNDWQDVMLHMYTPYWITYQCGNVECRRRALLVNPPAQSFFISPERGWFARPEIDYMNAVMDDDLTGYPRTRARSGIPRTLTHLVLNASSRQWDTVHQGA